MRNFITWIKGVLRMFFRGDTVKNAIGADIAVSDKMQKSIELWQKMFQGDAPWNDENTQSLGLASAVAGELARLTLVEFQSEVSGSARADLLQENYSFVLSCGFCTSKPIHSSGI